MNTITQHNATELINKLSKEFIEYGISLNNAIESAKRQALISINDKIEELMWLNLLVTFDNPIKNVMNDKIEELKQIRKEILNA